MQPFTVPSENIGSAMLIHLFVLYTKEFEINMMNKTWITQITTL